MQNTFFVNTISSEVTVTNINPTVSISKFEIADTMDRFIIESNLTDPGWLDTHTVSIDWGDNTIENIPIKEETSKIIATHKYNQLKSYTATLTVTDDNNGTTTSQITIKSPRQIKQSTLSKLQTIQTNRLVAF